jgi:hypothetical protein
MEKKGEKIKEFFKNHSENNIFNSDEKMNRTGIFFKSNISEKDETIINSNILNKTSTCFTKKKIKIIIKVNI